MPTKPLQHAAGALAESPLFRRGKRLFAENERTWNMPLTKFDKLWAGVWLILSDYSKGQFPPTFTDQQKAYQAEKNYRTALAGVTAEAFTEAHQAKPFWFGSAVRAHLSDFIRLTALLETAGLRPPAALLELGCGSGWTAEFLATMGYHVCGTTLDEKDVLDANRRIDGLRAKGIKPALRYVAAPMESVHQQVAPASFDGVFVYEALHHAFDWHAALRASHTCLKPGGWLLICNEPNVLHTCVAYRVAKLSNTHEIGFRRGELVAALRATGFQNIISAGPKPHLWFRPHWLLAQRTS